MACRIPILRFKQHCSTEATIVFVRRVVAPFARFFSFLILTSSSRTCSGTQKVSRISVFSLLYCFQLIHHRIMSFSSIQCCLALDRRFRFRSVVPNLRNRISHGKLPWGKYEFTGLVHWLDYRPNVSLLQQNPVCLDPTNSRLVASISFRTQLRLPSPVFRLILVCSLRLLDLNIDVFESPFSRPALPFSRLDLDGRTKLRCVCLDAVPPSSFEVQRCVEQHARLRCK